MKSLVHYCLWSVGLTEAQTQTSVRERECLERHARGKRRLVEIGVWHGVNTARFRRVMDRDGILWAVDPYPVGRLRMSFAQRIAHREVKWVANGTVLWKRMSGEAAAREYAAMRTDGVDFIFIDGDHSYEGLCADWLSWAPLITARGVVALHDSRSSAARRIDDAGSVRFTAEQILPGPRFEVIDEVDTLTVLSRRPD